MENSLSEDRPVGFLDLAAELRCMVYRILFAGARINVTNRASSLPWLANVSTGGEYASRYTTHTVGATRGFLRTCKVISAEAVAWLSKASSLAVYRHSERASPLDRVPNTYLLGIRNLEVDIHTFIWVPRKRLPSLAQVTLFHNIVCEDDQIVHMIGCDTCGRWLVTAITAEIQDWDFKRRQFKHLAKEENFEIDFVARLENPESIYLNLFIDMEKDCKTRHITISYPSGKVTNVDSLASFRQYHVDEWYAGYYDY